MTTESYRKKMCRKKLEKEKHDRLFGNIIGKLQHRLQLQMSTVITFVRFQVSVPGYIYSVITRCILVQTYIYYTKLEKYSKVRLNLIQSDIIASYSVGSNTTWRSNWHPGPGKFLHILNKTTILRSNNDGSNTRT